MIAENEEAPSATITLLAKPGEPDAGADLSLVATIACQPERDVSGHVLRLTDEHGALLAEAEAGEYEEGGNSAEFALKAPSETREHTWTVVLPAYEADGTAYDDVSVPVTLTVKPHATTILVWDMPSAIVARDRFRFKVGIRCTSGCGPAGWSFEVADQDGAQVAAGHLGDVPAPGTSALYFAEVEAEAPEAAGLHKWTVRASGRGHDLPHDDQSVQFGVQSVAEPECTIIVEAIDARTQAPVKGAKVVVHPHRTLTDDQGLARVRVAKGAYRIFVSGSPYLAFRAENEVTGDISIKAELYEDKGLSIADIWS